MRVQRADNREGKFSDLFGPPQIGVGVGPRRALQCCSSFLVWQAKKAVAEKKAADEEAEKVRSSPHWMDAVSVALRAPRCSCVEWEQRFHSHSALCRTPARAIARARADGGAMGATASALL